MMKFVIIAAVVVAVALAHGPERGWGPHKGGRGKCEKPTAADKGYAQLDAASQAKVDAIWVNYVNGSNCTEQQAATKVVFEAFFSAKILADIDAKVCT